MKHLRLIIPILISCSKHDDPGASLGLPEQTHNGANTFGALVNGQPFLPSGTYLAFPTSFVCAYITDSTNVNNNHFALDAGNQDDIYSTRRIVLVINAQWLQAGQSYKIDTYDNGDRNYAVYDIIYNSAPTDDYRSNSNLDGRLTITTLDPINHIISGTFYFNAVNPKGVQVSITEGRFDVVYDTQ
jgi:hypothetical protein